MNTRDTGIDAGRTTVRRRALVQPMVILFLATAVILGGIYGWQLFVGKMLAKSMSGMALAPQSVSTTVAVSTVWQSQTRGLGSVRAVRGADLAAQVSGVVDKIPFVSGAEVPAGAVLLTLKSNDDPAKLAQLQALAELASITLKRDQEQLAAQAVSQATVDLDISNLKSARAQLAAQQALIEEKTVRAPFAGQLGIRLVDEGQYLAAGTSVVTLQALNEVFIDFFAPQQALSRLTVGQIVTASVDAYPGVPFAGKITSINAKVDSASRNVQVRASFANADRKLVPGMYANVTIDSSDSASRITLPQTAITYNPYGDTVFLVQQDGKDEHGNFKFRVQQRFVKLGDTRGDRVAVNSGIAAGDVVVTSGQMKLRNGSAVTVNNKIEPSDDDHPTPPNE